MSLSLWMFNIPPERFDQLNALNQKRIRPSGPYSFALIDGVFTYNGRMSFSLITITFLNHCCLSLERMTLLVATHFQTVGGVRLIAR